jgi:hypothetical protein
MAIPCKGWDVDGICFLNGTPRKVHIRLNPGYDAATAACAQACGATSQG